MDKQLSLLLLSGESSNQLLLALVKHSLDTLKCLENKQAAACEQLKAVIEGINELFERIEDNGDQKLLIATDIVQSLCGRYLERLEDVVIYYGHIHEPTTMAIASLYITISSSIRDTDTLENVFDTVLKGLEDSKIPDDEAHQHSIKQAFATVLLSLLDSNAILPRMAVGRDTKVLQLLLSVLKHSSLPLCYEIAGRLLPCLLRCSPAPSLMAETIWDFTCAVWSGSTTVETSRADMTLTLMCCLHHLYLDSSTSLFTISTSNEQTTPAHRVLVDVRIREQFWDMVQSALVSSDPLSRKRGMFLLHRALSSADLLPCRSGGRKERLDRECGHSKGCVFWWGCGSGEETVDVCYVWEGVVLLLETLEEKQVRDCCK